MIKIESKNAPQAIGPYSQAVEHGGYVFCSGQIPLTVNGDLLVDTIESETTQVFKNLSAVLESAGSSFELVVKVTIFLTDMNDFAVVNEVYSKYFTGDIKPARSTVAVAALPKGARVEIECIAVKSV